MTTIQSTHSAATVLLAPDARRLAACWNVCAGIDTEALEAMAPGAFATLRAESAELVAEVHALHTETLALDDDTGAPVRLPRYITRDGCAYWSEPFALGTQLQCLMSAPLSAGPGALVLWGEAVEVEQAECPAYAEILAALAEPAA